MATLVWEASGQALLDPRPRPPVTDFESKTVMVFRNPATGKYFLTYRRFAGRGTELQLWIDVSGHFILFGTWGIKGRGGC
jgi:hypothetical protein